MLIKATDCLDHQIIFTKLVQQSDEWMELFDFGTATKNLIKDDVMIQMVVLITENSSFTVCRTKESNSSFCCP